MKDDGKAPTQQHAVFDDVEARMKALVAGMPGYPRFRAALEAIQTQLQINTSTDGYWVLTSIACAGDVTLFLLWCLGEGLVTRAQSQAEMLNLAISSKRVHPKAYQRSIDFLCGCLKQEQGNVLPYALLLAVKGWLDPKADAELLEIMQHFEPAVLTMFARDQQFINTIHQHMTFSLLGEESQHVSEDTVQEARKLFLKWDRGGDGLLSREEACHALRHYKRKANKLQLNHFYQKLLGDAALWSNDDMEFAGFALAYARHKAGPFVMAPSEKQQSQQEAVQLRSVLVCAIGSIRAFCRVIQDTKRDVTNDALNVYNNAVFHKSDPGHDTLRYLTALGTLAIQLILPLCIYLYAKEVSHNDFCSGGGDRVEQWTVAAIAIFYILLTAPACIAEMKLFFGHGGKYLRRRLSLRASEEIPRDIMRTAVTGVIIGRGGASPTRRAMAAVDLVMNTLYPSLISLLTLYLVYNGTSPIDMTRYVVFIHFLFQLDEKFLSDDPQIIRATIALTILATQHAAKVQDEKQYGTQSGSSKTSRLGTIAVHLFSLLCSAVAILAPFVFVGYLFAAPICL